MSQKEIAKNKVAIEQGYKQSRWPFILLNALSSIGIIASIIIPIFLLVIGGLYLAFSSDNPIGQFIEDNTSLAAFIILIAIFCLFFLAVKLINKVIKRR